MRKKQNPRRKFISKTIGYYEKGILKEVFPSVTAASKYFKVTYSVLYNSVKRHNSLAPFLNKHQNIKRIHANTYYNFYRDKFDKYVKYRIKKNLKFGCDNCLRQNKMSIAYNDKYKQLGLCEYCDFEREVSDGFINKWLRNNRILFDKKSHRIFLQLLPKPLLAPKPKTIIPPVVETKPEIKKSKSQKKITRAHKVLDNKTQKTNQEETIDKNYEPESKKELSNMSFAMFILSFGVVIAAICALIYLGISSITQTYKENNQPKNDVKVVRALLFDKTVKNNKAIMIYKNTEGHVWEIPNADTFWNNAEIGDSINVYYTGRGKSILFKKVEKITN